MLKAIIQNIHRGMSAQGPAFLMLSACLLLSACGKKESPKPAAEAPKPAPAVSDAKIDAAISDALASEKPNQQEVTKAQAALEAKAEDIISKYPDKNAQDLLNVPEVHPALKVGLTKLSENEALARQIINSASMTAKMIGMEGRPENVSLSLDLKSYDHARKSRMLQVVLSEDPKQIVHFLTEEIGEATPELSLGGAERASNGVAIQEKTPAAQK